MGSWGFQTSFDPREPGGGAMAVTASDGVGKLMSMGIEEGKLPWRFTQPTFTMYNGRTDPMEHVSHFNQRIAVHAKNEALMCKVFPSSLGLVAIRTFKVGLPAEHGLRKLLTGKPISSVRQLMHWIDKYKQVEEDQQLGKEKAKMVSQDRRDFRLQQFLYRPNGQVDHKGSSTQGNTFSRPLLGTINVIFAAPGRMGSCPSRVATVARPLPENSNHELKRAKVAIQLALSFSEKNKFGTIQPHDDPLVVTLRIEGFDGKMVIPMRQVKFPVQTGSEVVEVNFIVVDAYSPYTAIVARP
ncbi:uncharacterized protein LOC142625196 [Castanea sativa]|uniref:uncharacterized protein LOC142625196 n=1 Tax=Castanea sativa TaxID=21020 RepID=UPI003F64A01F